MTGLRRCDQTLHLYGIATLSLCSHTDPTMICIPLGVGGLWYWDIVEIEEVGPNEMKMSGDVFGVGCGPLSSLLASPLCSTKSLRHGMLPWHRPKALEPTGLEPTKL